MTQTMLGFGVILALVVLCTGIIWATVEYFIGGGDVDSWDSLSISCVEDERIEVGTLEDPGEVVWSNVSGEWVIYKSEE